MVNVSAAYGIDVVSRMNSPVVTVTDIVVNQFFDVYTDMDKDGTGHVDVEKFNRYFGMDRTPFSDRVFTVVGT